MSHAAPGLAPTLGVWCEEFTDMSDCSYSIRYLKTRPSACMGEEGRLAPCTSSESKFGFLDSHPALRPQLGRQHRC
jgi:hypothetical protein